MRRPPLRCPPPGRRRRPVGQGIRVSAEGPPLAGPHRPTDPSTYSNRAEPSIQGESATNGCVTLPRRAGNPQTPTPRMIGRRGPKAGPRRPRRFEPLGQYELASMTSPLAPGAEGPPGLLVDGVLDELDAAVAHQAVDAAGVVATGVGEGGIVRVSAARVPAGPPAPLGRVGRDDRVEHRHPDRADLPEDAAEIVDARPIGEGGRAGVQAGEDGGRVLIRVEPAFAAAPRSPVTELPG